MTLDETMSELKRAVDNRTYVVPIPILQSALGHLSTINPSGIFHHWRGECGHEWRKDQVQSCPICECDRLRTEIASISRLSSVRR